MKTIKLIDLLVKIANGEEVPKKIIADDNIYYYDETDGNEFYRYRTNGNELLTDYADLNEEVEIIEDTTKEDKKIEKLDYLISYDIQQFKDLREYVEITTNDLFGKTNKIIDKINEVIDKINGE